MICRSCQAHVEQGHRFCPTCGAEQGSGDTATAPTPPPDALIGSVIDEKYRLDSRIGVGGMGSVYRATRLLIGDSVAVKVLHAEQLRDPNTAERFRREAQAAARLKHPNAVAIHDFGISSEGMVYLVMELVEGDTLRRLIKEHGPLAPSAVAEILTLDARSDIYSLGSCSTRCWRASSRSTRPRPWRSWCSTSTLSGRGARAAALLRPAPSSWRR